MFIFYFTGDFLNLGFNSTEYLGSPFKNVLISKQHFLLLQVFCFGTVSVDTNYRLCLFCSNSFLFLSLFLCPQGLLSLSVSLSLIMLETLLGGGLPLAISIPIIKSKTRNRHLGAVCLWIGGFSQCLSLALGSEFGSGSWLLCGDHHMPIIWDHSFFLRINLQSPGREVEPWL